MQILFFFISCSGFDEQLSIVQCLDVGNHVSLSANLQLFHAYIDVLVVVVGTDPTSGVCFMEVVLFLSGSGNSFVV